MNGSSDALVVGGGLQGLSSAFQLARRGYRVRLLEAEYCGRHASGVNAGGVRTLGRHLAEIPLALAAREQLWHHLQELLGDTGGFVYEPGERLTNAEALHGYTRGAAIAQGDDDLGVIRAGARADLALWSADPTLVDGDDLIGLPVEATYLDGERLDNAA